MNTLQQIAILAGLSLLVAVGASVSNHVGGAIIAGDPNIVNIIFVPMFMAPVYFAFIFAAGLLLGIPTLIMLRRRGVSHRLGILCGLGSILGALASSAVVLASTRSAADYLEMGLLGGMSGLGIGVLWWWMVERKSLA